MNPKVTSVRAMANYRLHLNFTNGEQRVFDVSPFLDKGVFRQLRESSTFASAKVVAGSVEWPGEIDLSYDTLYLDSVPVSVQSKKSGEELRKRT